MGSHAVSSTRPAALKDTVTATRDSYQVNPYGPLPALPDLSSCGLPRRVSTCAWVIPGRMRRTFASVTPGCHTSPSVTRKATVTRNRATPTK